VWPCENEKWADQKFDVLVVPNICEPISPQPIFACVENRDHLSQLELTDEGGESPLRVDVLIGNGYYRDITNGKVVWLDQ